MTVKSDMSVFDECLVKGVYEKMYVEKITAEKACKLMASINDVKCDYVEKLFKKYHGYNTEITIPIK